MVAIGLVGAGKMAEALIKAILKANITKNITASDVSSKRLDYIKKALKIKTTKSNKEVVKQADVLILAIKPQNMADVLSEIKNDVTNKHLIVSIAAGVKIDFIQEKLGDKNRVIRVMPNTPCLVGEMAAGFAAGRYAKDKDIKLVATILNSAGKAYVVCEDMLDAVTGLSGSGPAFLAYVLEAMIEGGVKQGLSKDVATELAMQTMKGTGKLLQETGLSPKELIDMVSSPGGTTIAGRKVLEKSDVKKILEKTVGAATKRSKELGK
ncbi:pyrroline-5-carboxylate reductase [Candidatus Woesearchaeota archaeon]|nr:pyrroline-5-carboxylate reductase [Candidatus Woesearchaeota archaeon]